MNIVIGSLKSKVVSDFKEAFHNKIGKVFSVQNAQMCFQILDSLIFIYFKEVLFYF